MVLKLDALRVFDRTVNVKGFDRPACKDQGEITSNQRGPNNSNQGVDGRPQYWADGENPKIESQSGELDGAHGREIQQIDGDVPL